MSCSGCIAVNELYLTAMGCHLPYSSVLPPPDTNEHTPH